MHYQIVTVYILNEKDIFDKKICILLLYLVKFPRVCVKYVLTPPLVFKNLKLRKMVTTILLYYTFTLSLSLSLGSRHLSNNPSEQCFNWSQIHCEVEARGKATS